MRALFIVNPSATSTTPAARDLLAHALESRVQLTVAHTEHRGHAAELASWAAAEGIELVVVHGGDGTVNEAINGFLPAPDAPIDDTFPRIAVLPGGSANVFARSLGISADPVLATNQLIDLLSLDSTRRIGLGHADDRWFTFNAGMGIDAQVCDSIDSSRRDGKPATPTRYVMTAVRTFFANAGKPPLLTVEFPGQEPVDGVHYAFVSNSSPWTYLNSTAVHTNPGTTFDGGLGVFAMRSMGTFTSLRVTRQLLAAGAEPKSGSLIRNDDVEWVHIRSAAEIGLQMDGDYIGQRTEVRFRSVPAALQVVAPKSDT